MITYELMPVIERKGLKKGAETFMGDIVVIKCGGSVLDSLSDSFFTSVRRLQAEGAKPIIVHGGGPAINGMLAKLEVETTFVDGLRKTTDSVLSVAEMVLCGQTNKKVVRKLQKAGVKSIGLSGSDGELVRVKAIDEANLGYVGEPVHVNGELLHMLVADGFVPVLAPIGVNDEFEPYNVNADTVAGAVATALQAKELIFVTDVAGILKDDELVPALTPEEVESLIEEGTIYGGMIPKVRSAIHSLTGTLEAVSIVNGNDVFFAESGKLIGTTIKKQVIHSQG